MATKAVAKGTKKATAAAAQWDRFRVGREKVLVLWVKDGMAVVLNERSGGVRSINARTLAGHGRLARFTFPGAQKVHKLCKCCKTRVYVRASLARKMARAERRGSP